MLKHLLLFCTLFSLVSTAEGFIEGTLVKTPTGHTAIQNLAVGDVVISCDLKGHCVERRVTQVHQKQTAGYLEIEVGQTTLGCDADQPFYVPQTQEWKEALDLQSFHAVVNLDDDEVPVDGMRFIEQDVVLHTLTIEEDHNFYVGQDGVLVHNFAFAIVIPLGVGLFEALSAALGSAVVTAGVSLAVKAISDSASQQMDQHIINNPYIHASKDEDGKNQQVGNPLPRAMAQEVARQLGYPDRRRPPNSEFGSHGCPK